MILPSLFLMSWCRFKPHLVKAISLSHTMRRKKAPADESNDHRDEATGYYEGSEDTEYFEAVRRRLDPKFVRILLKLLVLVLLLLLPQTSRNDYVATLADMQPWLHVSKSDS
jgi:hypothetical protein